jgi:hypothetical protein
LMHLQALHSTNPPSKGYSRSHGNDDACRSTDSYRKQEPLWAAPGIQARRSPAAVEVKGMPFHLAPPAAVPPPLSMPQPGVAEPCHRFAGPQLLRAPHRDLLPIVARGRQNDLGFVHKFTAFCAIDDS